MRALVALAAGAALTMTSGTAVQAAPARAAATRSLAAGAPGSRTPVEQLNLPDGRTANVFGSGIVQVFSKDGRQVEYRNYPIFRSFDGKATVPNRAQLTADLMQGPPQPFVSNTVVVVLGLHSLQVNPNTRTGFTLAPQSAGLVPFKY